VNVQKPTTDRPHLGPHGRSKGVKRGATQRHGILLF
jgi:hypothetical protein